MAWSRRWLAAWRKAGPPFWPASPAPVAITKFKADDLATKIACQVPRGDGADGTFNPDQWVDPKEQRRMDDFIIYGLAAAKQAVVDSGWEPKTEEERCRTGVLIGSGIGGLAGIEDASILVHEKGPRRLSPFFIPGRLINLVSGYASIEHGYQGPQPCGGDGLRHRRACHRRCGAADRAGRCRCDAGGRRGSRDLPHRHRRLQCLPRAVHRVQRHARPRRRGPTTRTATAS